jgi:hypothetical protein
MKFIKGNICTGYTQKNGAVSKVNKKFISQLTGSQRTPSAAATVKVSHALITNLQCLHPGSHNSHSRSNPTLLQMETTTFSLGHPFRQILHRAISFFGGSLKTAFMYHHCPRPSMNFVIG